MASPYQTAGEILNRAGVQRGLGSVADPYAETGAQWVALQEALATACDDILRFADWRTLIKDCTITTVTGQTTYALPADFHEMIPQTGWNRTTRLPMTGPETSQEWQYLKSRQIGITITVLFRLSRMELEIYGNGTTTPSGGQDLHFDYMSTSGVQDAANVAIKTPAGSPIGDKAVPTQSADLVLFDPLLMVRFVKLLYSQWKGLDTTVLKTEFDDTLAHVKSTLHGAPLLNLGGPQARDRVLDRANIPETNYGA